MTCRANELTLDEVLADPVIGAAMRADRVDPRHFETLLRTTARRLDHSRGPSTFSPAGIAARSHAAFRRCAAAGDTVAW